MTPAVSVVVPTYRRPDLLERCLAALDAQTLDAGAYEIVVVDDAHLASTRRQVEAFAARARPAVRYLAVSGRRHGPAAARNVGWRAATGRVVAFTDDDAVADPGWLAAGMAAFVDGAAGVAGRVVVPLPAVPTDYERDAAGLETARFVTANCFYRRDALAAAGGFDERFEAAWREDSDLWFRLEDAGARLERCEAALVVHPVRPARFGVSLGQQRKARFSALLYKKHPARYRERIQAAPPWRYYVTVAALAGALAGAACGRRRLAAAALGAWTALTADFAARRLAGTSPAPSHVAEMVLTSALIPPLSIFWRLSGAFRFRVVFL
jgi:GT2 family glycosyltransferase